MARISGKLTAKSLGWDRNAIGIAVKKVPQDGGRVFIGRVVGSVSGIHETVSEDTGEVQSGLKGSFKGLSSLPEMIASGEKNVDGSPMMKPTGQPITMTAGRCYLPGGIQEMIEGAYKTAAQTDKNATITFGVDLYAVPASNKAGYSYDGDTVTEATDADPLDVLLNSANAIKAFPVSETTLLEDARTDVEKGAGKHKNK